MAKFRVHGRTFGSIYLGEFEAETAEQAMEMAMNATSVSFCHQCSDHCEDPEVEATYAYADDES